MPDLVHFQYESALYNEGMFSEGLLLQLIRRLHEANIKTVITLHNVPEFQPTVYYAGWYNKLNSQIIVTNKLMERELLKWEPEARITTIPLGSTIFTCIDKTEARTILNLPRNKYIITQAGFYGYDKGMLPLIETMPKILSDIPNAYLVFAGSIHPLAPPIHRDYVRQCIKKAIELNLQNYIKFVGRFLTEEEITQYISASDMLAINHQYVFGLYSSSASAHRVLASGKPIVMNSADVRLSEFRDGVHCVKVTNENLAEKIVSLSKDVRFQQRLCKGAQEYAKETSFPEIAKNHLILYKSCAK
jgi:glycosyltransferase involved in cell wall biosynthesis